MISSRERAKRKLSYFGLWISFSLSLLALERTELSDMKGSVHLFFICNSSLYRNRPCSEQFVYKNITEVFSWVCKKPRMASFLYFPRFFQRVWNQLVFREPRSRCSVWEEGRGKREVSEATPSGTSLTWYQVDRRSVASLPTERINWSFCSILVQVLTENNNMFYAFLHQIFECACFLFGPRAEKFVLFK